MSPEATQSTLTQIETGIAQDFDLGINRLDRINEGFVNEVYEAQTTVGPLIIRIARERNSYPYEIWAYNQFKLLGIPVPEMLGYRKQLTNIGFPTIVMTKLQGAPISHTELTEDQTHSIYLQAGKILRTIHTIEVVGYGYFTESQGTVRGMSNTWKAFWDEKDISDKFEALREGGLIDNSTMASLIDNFQLIMANDNSKPTFAYNDFHKDHIFTDGNVITGIIDPGNALAGTPLYDVAVALYYQNDQQQKAFLEGYGIRKEDPLLKQYLIFVQALKASFRIQKGNSERAKRDTDKLKSLLTD